MIIQQLYSMARKLFFATTVVHEQRHIFQACLINGNNKHKKMREVNIRKKMQSKKLRGDQLINIHSVNSIIFKYLHMRNMVRALLILHFHCLTKQ